MLLDRVCIICRYVSSAFPALSARGAFGADDPNCGGNSSSIGWCAQQVYTQEAVLSIVLYARDRGVSSEVCTPVHRPECAVKHRDSVCVRERERVSERESVCVRERVSERVRVSERECVCVCVSVCEWESG